MTPAHRPLISTALRLAIASAVLLAALVAVPPLVALADEGEAAREAGRAFPRPPARSRLTVGKDLDARPNSTYDPANDGEIAALERDLNEICPCLFIRITSGFSRSDQNDYRVAGERQEIIIRHPGDVADLSDNLRNKRNLPGSAYDNRSDAKLQEMSDDFCDCNKRHRAGCNLLWQLATGDTDVVIWKSELGFGNRHRPPREEGQTASHVGYNPNRDRSDESEPPETSRHRGTDRRPTSIGLAHELVHAYAHARGVKQSGNRRDDDYSEFVASRGENQIRQEMHDESEARLRPDSDDLDDAAKEKYGKYDNPWPWRGRSDLDHINRGTWPRRDYTDREGTQRIPDRSQAVISTADLFDCDKKIGYLPGWPADPLREGYAVVDPEPKKQGFLPGSQLPDGQEYAYRFAVEIPEQCVATTSIVTEGRVTETPVVQDGDNGLSTPTETPEDESGIPECVSIPISVTPPVEEVPSDPVSTPPAEDVPTAVDEPTEVPPPTVEKPPTEETPTEAPPTLTPPTVELPPEEEPPTEETPTEAPPTLTPPTVELPPEEEPPTPPSTPEEPDLGLVKAESRIVELVLTSVQTGEPVGSAVVKLLEPPPALPGTGDSDPSLSDAEQFAGDVPATLVDEQGRAALTLAEATPIAKDIAPVEEPTQPNTAGAGQVALKREVKIDTTPYKQFTVMAKSEGFRLPQEIGAISDKICLKRKFKIADKPVLVIRVPEEQAIEFVRKVEVSEVAFVEEDPCRKKEQASDPYFDGSGLWNQEFDNQWAIKRVGYDKGRPAFTSLPQDEPVNVAVIDTGVDWYHPDLNANSFWRNPKELRANGKDDDGNGYADDLIGWNFVEGDHLPWDYDGHGTFVTGVIAASRDNEIGIAGINPSARIMVLKALDAFGRGNASMIAEAIVYAADNGARIINLSLGGRGLTQIEQMAVTHASDKGAILVVAAGNDGEDVGQYSPSGLEGVVTVAATDRNDRRAGFSNWGPAIDIAAPGIDVLSLRARNTDLLSFIQNVKYEVGKGVLGANRAYYRASGTSFAAPIVSGTLSLLLSRLPVLSSEQAIRMVLHSARDIETPGVDNYTGFGLLDADAALASDPAYFLESRVSGAKVIAGKDGNLLRVIGTAAADQFDGATLMLGRGATPEKWLKVNKPVADQILDGPIMDLPARFFAGSQEWTIRLITKHKNGSTRESRFLLRLG